MRLHTGATFKLYYPDQNIDIFDGREVVVKYEQTSGNAYGNGDLVRLIYGAATSQDVGGNVWECYAPLVNGAATFYLPIPYSMLSRTLAFGALAKTVTWKIAIKTKNATDYNFASNIIHAVDQGALNIMGGAAKVPPIPVVFYSECGYGVFGFNKLNRQEGAVYDGKTRAVGYKWVNSGNFSTIRSDDVLGTGIEAYLGNEFNGIERLSIGKDWEAVKLCGNIALNYVQLLWAEAGAQTVRSFWFHVKGVEYQGERWGAVRYQKNLASTSSGGLADVARLSHDVNTSKRTLILSSGKYPSKIINELKKIVLSPIVWRYEPYGGVWNGTDTPVTLGSVMNLRRPNGTLTGITIAYTGAKSVSMPPYSALYGEFCQHFKGGAYKFEAEMTTLVSFVTVGIYIFQNPRKRAEGYGSHLAGLIWAGGSAGIRSQNVTFDSTDEIAPCVIIVTNDEASQTITSVYIRLQGVAPTYEVAALDRGSVTTTEHGGGIEELDLKLELNDRLKPEWVIL